LYPDFHIWQISLFDFVFLEVIFLENKKCPCGKTSKNNYHRTICTSPIIFLVLRELCSDLKVDR